MTRESLGFAIRFERQASMIEARYSDPITAEIESLKEELMDAAATAESLRNRANALRIIASRRELEYAA